MAGSFESSGPELSLARRIAPILYAIGGIAVGVLAARTYFAGQPQHVPTLPKLPPVVQSAATYAPDAGTNLPSQPEAGAAGTGEPIAENWVPTDDELWAIWMAPEEPTPAEGQPSILKGSVSGGANPPGSFAGGPVAPLNPVVIDRGSDEAGKSVDLSEIVVIVGEIDVDGTAKSIESIARSLGANVQSSRSPTGPGTREYRDLLLGVPAAKGKQLASEILKLSGAQETDSWNGPFSERRYRMERPIRESLNAMENQKRLLLLKYLDDAPVVVQLQEQIDSARRQLSSLKTVPSDRSAIRVYVSNRAPR